MIPENIRDEISQKLGSSPKPFLIPGENLWESVESDGVFWELLPLTDEDKPIEIRYHDLLMKAMKLAQIDIHDPNLKPFEFEIKQLIPGVKLFKLNGLEMFTKADLRLLDKNKGVRKEWFEIRSKYKGLGICFYLGFKRVSFASEEGVDILVVMPGNDQYNFLRIHRTHGNNHYISTEIIIKQLEKLNQEYGLSVLFATHDSLSFILDKPIEKENFSKIRTRIKRMCPDAEELTSQLHLGAVHLWWD